MALGSECLIIVLLVLILFTLLSKKEESKKEEKTPPQQQCCDQTYIQYSTDPFYQVPQYIPPQYYYLGGGIYPPRYSFRSWAY
jgi:hypothetical protein